MKKKQAIAIIGLLFFIFGFVTWLNGMLIPYLRIACQLTNFESYLVVFAFYISTVIMAIPSSWVIQRLGYRKAMAVGLLIMAAGAAIFIPAAVTRTYVLFLMGLFTIGAGMAVLQTASNPYVTFMGPIESAAKRMSLMGIFNKTAGILSPLVLGAFILKENEDIDDILASLSATELPIYLDELASRVILPYLLMSLLLVGLALFIHFSGLSEIDSTKNNSHSSSADNHKSGILQFPSLVLGVISLFLYIGVEVIAGDTIISYGVSQGIPFIDSKSFTSYTLAAMVTGYILGIFLIPRYLSQEKALRISATLGLVFSISAIFTEGYISVIFIALLGLANAIMWPAHWPLAMRGLGRFTNMGSSLLVMAISGGAIIPLAYGLLADLFTTQQAYWILIPCYLFIGYYSMVGYKKDNWQSLKSSRIRKIIALIFTRPLV